MLAEQIEAGQIALAVGIGCGGAVCLLGGVVELEGEDGEAVEDEAGGLGVERRVGVLGSCGGEERAIHGLDEVVARLVERVDGALDGSDAGVGGPRLAGLVFLVPEVEVGAVMCEREVEEAGGGWVWRGWARVGRVERRLDWS